MTHAAAPPADWHSRFERAERVALRAGRGLASAPLLLAVLTAAAAIFGQWIAKSWQDREHEHQLKGALVTEMSGAFTAPLLTAESIATGVLVRHVSNPSVVRDR